MNVITETESVLQEPSSDQGEGWVCLDFANTLEWHASNRPEEHVPTFEKLARWAGEVGILSPQGIETLLRRADGHPAKARKAYEKALALREAVYRVFSSVAADKEPNAADLTLLNAVLSEALCHLELTQSEGTFTWRWSGGEDEFDSLLWPVARSAGELLTSGDLDRVGECADDRGCGWLFFDMSRNRSRRWCDMKDCGNRDKVRRYYARKKQSEIG